MIKLKNLIGYPSLQYHIDNKLSLHEHVYRYNSEAFIQLFKEAREALSNEEIELSEEDRDLIETTDIGEYGDYNGMKVPLDLPMVSTSYNPLFEIGEDTKDSPGLATGAPTLYKTITGPVADERVVRGMAEALEAFDYLNALPTSQRSMTNGNTNYRQIITGLGIADDFGSSFYIDDAEKDGHAQAYALSWFMDAISGMDEQMQQVLGAEFAAVLRALDRPGGNARNDLSGGLRTLDLPRFRESAF